MNNYNLDFYKNVSILNHYNKITHNCLKDIISQYRVGKCPKDYIINKREREFFIHKLEKIKENYKNQIPFYKNNTRKLFKISSKKGYKELAENTTMYEKDLCKEMWFASQNGAEYPFEIIDIQTPLKSKQKDNYGEIDMVGIGIEQNQIYIYMIEVKPLNTKETLLRATIESITYHYIVLANKEKFISDFKKYLLNYYGNSRLLNKIQDTIRSNPDIIPIIKPLILVPKELYTDSYSKEIINAYESTIEYYVLDYSISDLEYKNEKERIPTLFKPNCYPKILKYKR